MSKYHRTEVYVVLYRFVYVHILYLRYFILSYVKKIESGYVVCTILNILSYLYKKGVCAKKYIIIKKEFNIVLIFEHNYSPATIQ